MDSNESLHLPMISIIIASLNSESQSYLRRCLESIRNQDYTGEIELIIADGGSTDQSISLSLSFGAKVISNPQVTELGFEGGKNLGIKHSTGEFILLIDADNILIEKNYIQKMLEPFLADSSVSMTIPIPYVPRKKEAPSLVRFFAAMELTLWREKSKNGIAKKSWLNFSAKSIIVPNGALMRRMFLEKAGGWDYDTEVGRRLIDNGFSNFALVNVHRYHIEMRSYLEVYKKFKRRMINQIKEKNNKPTVQGEMINTIHHPAYYLRNRIYLPLLLLLKEHDLLYLQTFPVSFIEFLLILKYYRPLTSYS